MDPTWSETMSGGSAAAERAEFARLARDIMQVQNKTRRKASSRGVPHGVDRAFHARSTLATGDAELRFHDLPADLCAGWVQPGAAYPTTVRFSNAAGTGQPDAKPDFRGVALRVQVSAEESHDLLMTNFPVSHARDARQFVAFAVATAGSRLSVARGLCSLLLAYGPREVVRMLKNIKAGRGQDVRSVATQTYWSRGAMRWGPTLAVRYLLRPAAGTSPAPLPRKDDPAFLTQEMGGRLAAGDVQFELCVQRYVDERRTPIEDTAVEWTEAVAPPEPVATLTVRRADVGSVDALAQTHEVDALAFNPWNTTEEFRPLGNLNRARKAAYDASAAHRLGVRWEKRPPLHNVVIGGAARGVFGFVNRFVEWHRLPVRAALLNLEVFRYVLRRDNLLDTDPQDAPPTVRPVPPSPADERARCARSYDGSSNDLSAPRMGAVGTVFGRNMAPVLRPETFDDPNPVVVSRELLYRDRFRPATSLNTLAAAWIQFQVHDWVNHARYRLGEHDIRVPLPVGSTWSNTPDGPEEREMRIADNVPLDGDRPGPLGPTFANSASAWWDGSEVYGLDSERANTLREGAKLRLTAEGNLPEDLKGQEVTGFNESWWLGLSSLHTTFAREHNVLCDELRAHYRGWDDERVYQTARLIVSALIAKIHTVEWTPGILATEAIDVGLKANWNGPQDWLTKLGIWLVDTHSSVGIPATEPDHHGAPYSLTEDFVTVYRLHPLLPDDYRFADHATGSLLGHQDFDGIQGAQADDRMRELGLTNALYSFGTSHPGAITLHNYPRALQRLERDGEMIDLSVVDLVRTRRRGVPRYNDFRAALHKPRVRHWEQLCADEESVRRLREVYRSVDDVDTMVGLFAETPPDGFGFSDTAFRIFILMASRRLQSDRFLTVDFRPEIYTPFGLDWIANNTMTSVILRHCPELTGVIPRGGNAFAPWRAVASGVPTREEIRLSHDQGAAS